jgi:hypothetical protein
LTGDEPTPSGIKMLSAVLLPSKTTSTGFTLRAQGAKTILGIADE